LVGDAGVFNDIIKRLRSGVRINAIKEVAEAKFQQGIIDVIDLKNVDLSKLEF
jgi:4-hydroxythreonine-4-phosphate dehydrogenase